MNTETNTIAIPRKVFREIRWHLKHFNDLDDYIKTRENQLREELFDYYHFTNKNSLKNIHSYGYTVENCIIALDEDRLIRRYKKWKKIIRKYMNDLDNKDDFIYYWIVKYTFFDKRNIEFIKEHLNLDKYELREKLMTIFYELYQIGIEEKLYKEVAINV